MKKIISIILSIITMFYLCACGNENKTQYSNYEENINFEQTSSQPDEIIKYISKYDKGTYLSYDYYNRSLNIHFDDMGVSDYKFLGTYSDDLYDNTYIIAMRYYGGSENQTTDLEIMTRGFKESFIGIYAEDSNGKTLDEHINEIKNNTQKKFEEDLVNRNLVWNFKDITEFELCNHKYNMLSVDFKEIDSAGYVWNKYTYWELCSIIGDKLITIHCSGNTKENKIEEMLSAFEEIGPERKQISFGSYEQDNITSNGKEDIEWYILEEDTANKKALIISKQALSYKRFLEHDYDQADDYYTYEKSSIRAWLNTDFLNDAFNNEEREKILVTKVLPEKYPSKDAITKIGNSTDDKVFLLSFSEFEKYFTTDNDKSCQIVSEYVTQQIETLYPDRSFGIYSYYHLLLRNVGMQEACSSHADEYGRIYYNSVFGRGIIYPAMWITLE